MFKGFRKYIKSDSWLTVITAENVFLDPCYQTSSYKHASYIDQLRGYGQLKPSFIENK